MRWAGYLIDLTHPRPRPGKQPEIRVFAISEAGMASELLYRNPYPRGDREYVRNDLRTMVLGLRHRNPYPRGDREFVLGKTGSK